MVKQAKTDREKHQVSQYLHDKGSTPISKVIRYKTDKDGKIIGAYAIETKVFIEPLQADDNMTAFELITDAIACASALGLEKVHFLTNNPKAVDVMTKRFEAEEWTSGGTELIIKL